jgi:hypothetical protein
MQSKIIAAIVGIMFALGLSPVKAEQHVLPGGTHVQLSGTLTVRSHLSQADTALPIIFHHRLNKLIIMTNSSEALSLSYPMNQSVRLQIASPVLHQSPIGCNFDIYTRQTSSGIYTRISATTLRHVAHCSVSPASGGAGYHPHFFVDV